MNNTLELKHIEIKTKIIDMIMSINNPRILQSLLDMIIQFSKK